MNNAKSRNAQSSISTSILKFSCKSFKDFHISEYLISFFLVAIGTSLPELVVDLTAIRKGQYELAIGDIIGSCIVDASVSIGIGQVFFPQAVSGELAVITGLYAIFGSIVVISTLALREKVDKKAGALFILVYLLSYTLLPTLLPPP